LGKEIMNLKQCLKDLDEYFIHELQTIYVNSKPYQYFKEETLECWLLDGQSKYHDTDKSIIYTAIQCFKYVINDIVEENQITNIFGNHSDKLYLRETLLKLINDYSKLLT
jgi:hypothetical protein